MLNFTIPKRTELFLWTLVPAALTLLLLLLCTIPKHLWGISAIMPILPLTSIFYWGRIKSTEIPFWFAFVIGLLMDSVSGMPLGISALLYMVFLVALHSRSKHLQNQGFMFIWWYFAVLLAIFCTLQFIIMSLYDDQIFSFVPAFLQWLITAGLYPLLHKLFDNLAEKCQHRRWFLTIIR